RTERSAAMLRFHVHNARERQQVEHAAGPIEFGRGPRRGTVPRGMIQDAYVSKEHLRIEELGTGEGRGGNLGTKRPVGVGDGSIRRGGSGQLMPPVRLGIGDTFIDVEPGIPEEVDRDSLKTVMQPLRPKVAGDSGVCLLHLTGTPTPEVLTQLFEAVLAVQR